MTESLTGISIPSFRLSPRVRFFVSNRSTQAHSALKCPAF